MEKVHINKQQFFILFLISIIANDKISGIFGAEIKQNKLIAYFFSIMITLLIFTMYYTIFKNVNFKSFFETFDFLLGKLLSKIVLIFYALYFAFIAALDTRDIIEFIYLYLLSTTPILLLRVLFLGTIYLSLLHGIEVMARVAQLLFNIVFFVFVTFSILIILVNPEQINIECFFPILEYGFKPLIKPILFMSVSIPFGEFFIIMVIFHHINDKRKVLLTGILAQLGAGFMIVVVFTLNLLILSPETLSYMLSPALRISRRIDIEGFFQRLDFVVIMILLVLSYIKSSLLIYGANHCLAHVFKIKREVLLYSVICIVIFIFSIFYFPNYILLLKFSTKFVMPYINTTFEFFIPFILFVLSFLKKGKLKKEEEANKKIKAEPIKKIKTLKEKFLSLIK